MTKRQRVRVGVFFDGTGNNQANAGRDTGPGPARRAGSYANAPSNIALLHALYPTGSVDGQVFLKVYVQGVGTREGAPDSLYAQLTGRGETGVEARVKEALVMVDQQLRRYRPSDVEFDLFGFSRGAAAARDLANRLMEAAPGLPQGLRGDRVINFIGLFDTVAAFVAPLRGDFDPANNHYHGLRFGLRPGVARQTVQLVAGQERRRNFPLVRSDNDIIVPGVHSNIGGGYRALMREQVLLCKPYSSWEARTTPLKRSRAYVHACALLETAFADVAQPRPRLISWEASKAGSRARRDEPDKQVFVALYREREVNGHLSRVYLSVMRELALRGGVPFAQLGDVEAHWVPEELQGISRKLHDFALGHQQQLLLTEEEHGLLQAKYVHTSAHWNAVKNLNNSALDVFYLDRPSEGGRVMHDNPVS
ncbi:phospholipase effector Tle1 domain-containing protein [Pseudomonas sp. NPDC089752]|uniref:phospholipase effector Tle1 domain-containing protein n=1 Tax=Pseudomonas sp. NPDC089752 TaxID=3364472 RepID=UPI00381D6D4F